MGTVDLAADGKAFRDSPVHHSTGLAVLSHWAATLHPARFFNLGGAFDLYHDRGPRPENHQTQTARAVLLLGRYAPRYPVERGSGLSDPEAGSLLVSDCESSLITNNERHVLHFSVLQAHLQWPYYGTRNPIATNNTRIVDRQSCTRLYIQNDGGRLSKSSRRRSCRRRWRDAMTNADDNMDEPETSQQESWAAGELRYVIMPLYAALPSPA